MQVKTYEYEIKYGDHRVAFLGVIVSDEGHMGYNFLYAKDTWIQLGNLADKGMLRVPYTEKKDLPVELTNGEQWEPDTLHHQYNDRQTRNGTGMRMVLTGTFQ